MAKQEKSSWLEWRTVVVGGRLVAYGEAGEGPPVLFLHGWGLDHRAYKAALGRLVAAGLHVVAPAIPGFGGSDPLPGEPLSLGTLSSWLSDLLDELGLPPVVVMGHSFGGALAIAFAHDRPEKVRALVLVNSVGASAWAQRGGVLRSMADRPLWDWGLHLPEDLWPLRQMRRVLPVVVSEVAANLVHNPGAFWRVAHLARQADLTAELEVIRDRGLPVVVLWGKRDRLVTRQSFEEMCRLLGDPPSVTVDGTHSWLIADPDAFGEIMTNVVGLPGMVRPRRRWSLLPRSGSAGSPARRPGGDLPALGDRGPASGVAQR